MGSFRRFFLKLSVLLTVADFYASYFKMWKVTTRLSYELIEVTLSFLVQTDPTAEREIE